MTLEHTDVLLILTCILGAFLIIVLPTVIGIMWKSWSKLSANVEKNTHALIALQATMSNFKPWTECLPKMRDDINNAHDKLRERGF